MRISDWSSDVCSSDLVERRHPIQFVRGDAQLDRHALGAQLAQIDVAFFRRRINTGIEPQTELGRDGLDDAGTGVVWPRCEVSERIPAPLRDRKSTRRNSRHTSPLPMPSSAGNKKNNSN